MPPEPCTQLHRISTLEKSTDALMDKLLSIENKFDGKLDLILMQINKIAVLEANHANHSSALGRAFDKIDEIESDNRRLNDWKSHTEGMARMAWMLWGSLGAGTLALIYKVFLTTNGG